MIRDCKQALGLASPNPYLYSFNYFFLNQGINALVVRWYSRNTSPLFFSANSSDMGIPVNLVKNTYIRIAGIIPKYPLGEARDTKKYDTQISHSKK
jgi:hypothetical protein